MSTDLLSLVPLIARYRREALADEQNAFHYWDQAARALVAADDEELLYQLDCDEGETCDLGAFPGGRQAEELVQFLENNRETLELLRAGVRCGKVQIAPLDDEEGSVAEHAHCATQLFELARAWFVHARWLMAEGDHAAAARELVALGQMGQLLCGGEVLVMHYLMGRIILTRALEGMRFLAEKRDLPSPVRNDLLAAVQQWLASAPEVVQCLRVELCCYALPEIDRLAGSPDPEAVVNDLLDRHYQSESWLPEESARSNVDDRRLDWRRDLILELLKGHPRSFDRVATIRLMSALFIDRILVLQPPAWWNVAGQWTRAVNRYRAVRFHAQSQLWPTQLRSSFLYECLGPSEEARRNLETLRASVSEEQWAEIQPPAGERLAAARRAVRGSPNALGVLVADALASVEITKSERQRRQRLRAVRAALAGQES